MNARSETGLDRLEQEWPNFCTPRANFLFSRGELRRATKLFQRRKRLQIVNT